MDWILVKDEAPPHNQSVLIAFKGRLGKSRVVKAMYTGKHELEADSYESDFLDYSEDEDRYYWVAGWYEDVYAETGLDYSFIYLGSEAQTPTHWMPLPAAPVTEE